MAIVSAGLLLYRIRAGLEVLLVHPGGPIWKHRDLGAWSIPKGKIEKGEDALEAAKREFLEEVGMKASGTFLALSTIRQKSGKLVHAWAFEGDLEAGRAGSNTFEMEWPMKSGRRQSFPEIDRAEFFEIGLGREKIIEAQRPFLEELEGKLKGDGKTA